jgi:hypothetical protein
MEPTQVASFIIRFQLADLDKNTNRKSWRIKVTHVQTDEETHFESLEEATVFMKKMIGESES